MKDDDPVLKGAQEGLSGSRPLVNLADVEAAGAVAGAFFWKAAKIIAVAVLAFVILLAAGGFFWIRRTSANMLAQGKSSAAEGKAFGSKTTQDACVLEAVSRPSKAALAEKMLDRVFMMSCLQGASASAGLCDSVPPRDAPALGADWRSQQCRKLGHAESADCGGLMEDLQDYCLNPAAKMHSTLTIEYHP